jgi:deoxyribodipyrimidine photolyase
MGTAIKFLKMTIQYSNDTFGESVNFILSLNGPSAIVSNVCESSQAVAARLAWFATRGQQRFAAARSFPRRTSPSTLSSHA